MKILIKIKITVLLIVSVLAVNAQQGDLNSVKKSRINNEISLSDIKLYIDSAKTSMYSDPQKSYDMIEKAMLGSIKGQYTRVQGECYMLLGDISLSLKQYDLAETNYKKAIPFISSDKDKEYTINKRLAYTYYLQEKHSESLRLYSKLLKSKNKPSDNEDIFLNEQIAKIYRKQKQYNKAINNYNTILKKAQKDTLNTTVTNTLNDIGEVYLAQKNDSKSLEYFNKANQNAINTNDIISQNRSLNNISQYYRNTKQVQEEINVRQQKIQTINKLEDSIFFQKNDLNTEKGNSFENIYVENSDNSDNKNKTLIEDNLELGYLYKESKNYKMSIEHLEMTLKLAKESEDLTGQSKALNALSEVYDKQGKFKIALNYIKKMIIVSESISNEQQSQLISQAKVNTEFGRKYERIDLLEREREINEKTINLLRQQQEVKNSDIKAQSIIIYSLLAGILAIFAASVLIYRSSKQKRKANQLLALKSLRSQMNPHFIFNSLNSVNAYISKSDERAANKFLTDFSKLMRMVMENSKHDFVTFESELTIITLYLKLEHQRFRDKFDYQLNVSKNIDTGNYYIPPMLIQPFIENAVWHGLRYKEEKGNLTVNINEKNKSLTVIIEDDGIGRKKSAELKTKNQKKNKSTGLKNIEGRLKLINHLYKANMDINIEDLPNDSGTKVTINLYKGPANGKKQFASIS